MNKKIVVLTAPWILRYSFVDALHNTFKGTKCTIKTVRSITGMDDIVAILGWENKQGKINMLAQELYETWYDIDDKAFEEATHFIDNKCIENNLVIMHGIIGDNNKLRLEEQYPNQVVYFDVSIEDESTLETEIERLINIEQLRLKKYINND